MKVQMLPMWSFLNAWVPYRLRWAAILVRHGRRGAPPLALDEVLKVMLAI